MTSRAGISGLPCHSEGLATLLARTPHFSPWHRCLQVTGTLTLLEEDGPWTVLVPDEGTLHAMSEQSGGDLFAAGARDTLCDLVESLVFARSIMALQLEVAVSGQPCSVAMTNLLDQVVNVAITPTSVSWNGEASLEQVLAGNGELFRLSNLPRGIRGNGE